MNRWTLWIFCLCVWTTLLLLPSDDIPQIQLGTVWNSTVAVAKTVHVLAYAFLTLLAGRLRAPPRFRWILVFVMMLHGTVTELLQLATYDYLGRSGELTDVGLDNLGVTIGLILSWKWWSDARG